MFSTRAAPVLHLCVVSGLHLDPSRFGPGAHMSERNSARPSPWTWRRSWGTPRLTASRCPPELTPKIVPKGDEKRRAGTTMFARAMSLLIFDAFDTCRFAKGCSCHGCTSGSSCCGSRESGPIWGTLGAHIPPMHPAPQHRVWWLVPRRPVWSPLLRPPALGASRASVRARESERAVEGWARVAPVSWAPSPRRFHGLGDVIVCGVVMGHGHVV